MGILRRAGLALAALTLLCATGCADDDAPPDTRPTPSASSPTPSTTPTRPAPPTLPASATPDQKGAEAFVRHFWAVFNYTYATNDTAPLKSLSDKDCRFCQSVIAQVDKWREEEARVEGGGVTVSRVVAPPDDVRKGSLVACILQQEAGQVVSPDGRADALGQPVKDQRSDVLVAFRADRWQMLGVSFGGPEGDDS